MIQLLDRLTLDAPKRTQDGFMVVRAHAARTGIYDYLASEVGAPADKFQPGARVKVYRDEAEVFDAASVRSFIGRAITNDHPSVAVTADNWREHARGTVMGAMRDGDHLAFDLVLMDGDTIADVEAGKRELSNGYRSVLDWTPGTSPSGEAYDARQTQIRGNHVAIVRAGRAGSTCAIKDGEAFALCDANPAAMADFKQETKVPKIIMLDGLSVNLGDEAAVEAAIVKYQGIITARDATITDLSGQVSTLSGEKVALDKQLADAKSALEPATLDKMVADRAALVTEAKALCADVETDGRTADQIRRAVVDAKLGDKAKDLDDKAVVGAYAVLAAGVQKDAKPMVPAALTNPLRIADNGVAVEAMRLSRYN